MAWANTLLDCKFRGVALDVVGTKDAYGRAVSVAEVPYVSGGIVEDLGGRPVRYSLQVVFFGEDYEDRLFQAIDAFNTFGPGELVHPVIGVIKAAQCVNFEVTHSAPEPDACTVQVEFIESGDPVVFWCEAGADDVQFEVGALGDTALDQMAASLSETVQALRDALPLAEFDALRQSMLGPLLYFTSQVQGVIASGLEVMDYPRAWASDIAALSNGVLSIISTPGRVMDEWRAIISVFKNIGAQWGFGSSSGGYSWPATSPAQPGSVPTEAQAQLTVRAYLSVNHASACADAAASLLASEAATPTLSPAEIETVTAAARDEINAAITAVRAALPLEKARAITEPLKDLALALQKAAQAIIERRPPLIYRTLDGAGNLRLIAHLWYGDHTRAPELARLNNLRLPNALSKGDVLRGYAK